jgi:hypothetical protein
VARHQLSHERDQRHQVNRLPGSRAMQDRSITETDSARSLSGGSSPDMATAYAV